MSSTKRYWQTCSGGPTFTIDGPSGTVTLRAMLLAFQNQLSILGDLDAALAGRSEPISTGTLPISRWATSPPLSKVAPELKSS